MLFRACYKRVNLRLISRELPRGPSTGTTVQNDVTGAVEVYSTKDRKGKTGPLKGGALSHFGPVSETEEYVMEEA